MKISIDVKAEGKGSERTKDFLEQRTVSVIGNLLRGEKIARSVQSRIATQDGYAWMNNQDHEVDIEMMDEVFGQYAKDNPEHQVGGLVDYEVSSDSVADGMGGSFRNFVNFKDIDFNQQHEPNDPSGSRVNFRFMSGGRGLVLNGILLAATHVNKDLPNQEDEIWMADIAFFMMDKTTLFIKRRVSFVTDSIQLASGSDGINILQYAFRKEVTRAAHGANMLYIPTTWFDAVTRTW